MTEDELAFEWPKGNVVYVLRSHDKIKVGTSSRLRSRFAELQTACSETLVLVGWREGDRDDEQAIHGVLEQHRLHGEWFRDSPAAWVLLRRCGVRSVEVMLDPTRGARRPANIIDQAAALLERNGKLTQEMDARLTELAGLRRRAAHLEERNTFLEKTCRDLRSRMRLMRLDERQRLKRLAAA